MGAHAQESFCVCEQDDRCASLVVLEVIRDVVV
jgi:hypothetical protein